MASDQQTNVTPPTVKQDSPTIVIKEDWYAREKRLAQGKETYVGGMPVVRTKG